MVNGQFKCLGSIQNLKSKFGKGYTLIVKCKKIQDDEMAKVEEFIAANVKFAKVKGELLYRGIMFNRFNNYFFQNFR